MRRILVATLAISLLIHAWALFGIEFGMFGETPESPPLQAVLRTPSPLPAQPAAPDEPPPAAALPATPVPENPLPARNEATIGPAQPVPQVPQVPQVPENAAPMPLTANSALSELASASPAAAVPESAPLASPAAAVLAGSGRLAFVVVKESLGMQIGRAEHRWEFAADGSYRLQALIETSGLAALLKPLRQAHESFGRLGPHGLQPEHFRVSRNGRPRGENADFDWSTAEVRLERDGSVHRVAPGTQDLLSLNYQLAYLRAPENGATIGVVTGRKYERYALDSLGEEEVDTPAGRFRALHLRAAGDTLTEIWIALDQRRLPVKIRFTDRHGDSYTQLAAEIDIAVPALP